MRKSLKGLDMVGSGGVSRRDVIRTGAAGVGVVAVGGAGLGAWLVKKPLVETVEAGAAFHLNETIQNYSFEVVEFVYDYDSEESPGIAEELNGSGFKYRIEWFDTTDHLGVDWSWCRMLIKEENFLCTSRAPKGALDTLKAAIAEPDEVKAEELTEEAFADLTVQARDNLGDTQTLIADQFPLGHGRKLFEERPTPPPNFRIAAGNRTYEIVRTIFPDWSSFAAAHYTLLSGIRSGRGGYTTIWRFWDFHVTDGTWHQSAYRMTFARHDEVLGLVRAANSAWEAFTDVGGLAATATTAARYVSEVTNKVLPLGGAGAAAAGIIFSPIAIMGLCGIGLVLSVDALRHLTAHSRAITELQQLLSNGHSIWLAEPLEWEPEQN